MIACSEFWEYYWGVDYWPLELHFYQ